MVPVCRHSASHASQPTSDGARRRGREPTECASCGSSEQVDPIEFRFTVDDAVRQVAAWAASGVPSPAVLCRLAKSGSDNGGISALSRPETQRCHAKKLEKWFRQSWYIEPVSKVTGDAGGRRDWLADSTRHPFCQQSGRWSATIRDTRRQTTPSSTIDGMRCAWAPGAWSASPASALFAWRPSSVKIRPCCGWKTSIPTCEGAAAGDADRRRRRGQLLAPIHGQDRPQARGGRPAGGAIADSLRPRDPSRHYLRRRGCHG